MSVRNIVKILAFLLICSAAYAMSSASYVSGPVSVAPGGGGMVSSSYTSRISVGGASGSKMTSTSYIAESGYIAEAAGTGDAAPPTITGVMFDGRAVVADDFIKRDCVMTAEVKDDTAIDTALSSVEVDGTFTTFAALSGSSSYNASTGLLTYAFSFASDGNHSVAIHAVDTSSNSATASIALKVNSSSLITANVFMYPNPFNPNTGAGVIAYQLSQDNDITLFIFNAIGQVIVKKTFLSGAQGGLTGYNEIAWDGKDDFGSIVGNDVYFVRIVAGGKVIGKTKIAVIK